MKNNLFTKQMHKKKDKWDCDSKKIQSEIICTKEEQALMQKVTSYRIKG